MYTDYDRKLDKLVDDLKECLTTAKELVVDDTTWGYDEYADSGKMKQYVAIQDAIGLCLRG
jgi:hypothetical protein